jgi:hypothetical protein
MCDFICVGGRVQAQNDAIGLEGCGGLQDLIAVDHRPTRQREKTLART